MVPTICAVGETRDNTAVDTSTPTPAPATRNKLSTPNLRLAQSGGSNFVRHLPTAGLSPDVTQIIRASWRVSTQSAYNTPVRRWLDFCNRWQLNSHQSTVSQVLDFLHALYELGLSHSATGTHCQSAISALVEIHTLHMLSVFHMDQSPDKVIFHIIGLTKCSKPTRPNRPIVYRAYAEDELLCPVKCIYAYLTQRSKIITQNFTEFFITFGKPHHPASKDTLARWVKEVMGNSGIDTEIFKPHSTRVASNSAAYKLGMPLQEVLKRGQWSNAGTFFTYYFREIEDSLDLDEQQDS